MYITSYSKEMLITTEEYIRAIDKHGESYIGASWESLNPDIATISKKDDEEIEVMVIQAVELSTTTITATAATSTATSTPTATPTATADALITVYLPGLL